MNYKNIIFLFAILCCSTSHVIFSDSDHEKIKFLEKRLNVLQEQLKNLNDTEKKLILSEGHTSNANKCFIITVVCSIAAGLSLVIPQAPKGSFSACAFTGCTTGVIGLVTTYTQQTAQQNIATEKKQIIESINHLHS